MVISHKTMFWIVSILLKKLLIIVIFIFKSLYEMETSLQNAVFFLGEK